ncbi:MAG: hypothetical protein HQL65_05790 [Magnetococcales bacterium]|nr:hypothetical protein [Magnetococcales bacterium]
MYKFDDGIKNQVSNILNGSRKGITEAKTEYDQYLAANRARQQVQRVTGLNPTPEFLVAHMTGDPQHMEYLRQDLGTAMSQKDPTTLNRMESNLNDAHTFSRSFLGLKAPARKDDPSYWDTGKSVNKTLGELNGFLGHSNQSRTGQTLYSGQQAPDAVAKFRPSKSPLGTSSYSASNGLLSINPGLARIMASRADDPYDVDGTNAYLNAYENSGQDSNKFGYAGDQGETAIQQNEGQSVESHDNGGLMILAQNTPGSSPTGKEATKEVIRKGLKYGVLGILSAGGVNKVYKKMTKGAVNNAWSNNQAVANGEVTPSEVLGVYTLPTVPDDQKDDYLEQVFNRSALEICSKKGQGTDLECLNTEFNKLKSKWRPKPSTPSTSPGSPVSPKIKEGE